LEPGGAQERRKGTRGEAPAMTLEARGPEEEIADASEKQSGGRLFLQKPEKGQEAVGYPICSRSRRAYDGEPQDLRGGRSGGPQNWTGHEARGNPVLPSRVR